MIVRPNARDLPATDVLYLPEIAGRAPGRRPDFDREQWTTCHLGSLTPGMVFALPGARREPVRPVVLAEVPRREDVPEHIDPHMNAESQGVLVGEAIHVDTGEAVAFRLLARTPVLTRCDLRYEPRTGGGRRG